MEITSRHTKAMEDTIMKLRKVNPMATSIHRMMHSNGNADREGIMVKAFMAMAMIIKEYNTAYEATGKEAVVSTEPSEEVIGQ
jgi:hypothetical protein